MILLELLLGFLEIGVFSFGGAYSAIPLIREVVLSYGWIDDDKLSYMIAVSESTPGPIMVNMATYIGSEKAGVLGAAVATLAVILPAFLIVLILTLLLKNLIKKGAVQSILGGLKSCVAGVILATGAFMLLKCFIGSVTATEFDIYAVIIAAVLAVIYFGSKKIIKNGISPIILIIISGVAGVLVYGWK
ncbi:MAG: chromate transporter [Clostridia bacterium]|nr:chromate transporter [Clostridia bacterium]